MQGEGPYVARSALEREIGRVPGSTVEPEAAVDHPYGRLRRPHLGEGAEAGPTVTSNCPIQEPPRRLEVDEEIRDPQPDDGVVREGLPRHHATAQEAERLGHARLGEPEGDPCDEQRGHAPVAADDSTEPARRADDLLRRDLAVLEDDLADRQGS